MLRFVLTAHPPLCLAAVTTVTTLAQDTSACVTGPGCGYQTDGSGSVCKIGTFSAGGQQQPCEACPNGLTTVAAASDSITACMAPPGYFFQVQTCWLGCTGGVCLLLHPCLGCACVRVLTTGS